MKTYLKVKICSLAEEIRIIKRQERKWAERPLFNSLREHRGELNREVRYSSLAYGFLRGRDYLQIERTCYFTPEWPVVEALVRRFGGGFKQGKAIDVERDVMQRWQGWVDNAQTWSNSKVCVARRVDQMERGTQRRQSYKAKYWRPEPADQAKLKAELKAKWEGKKVVVGYEDPIIHQNG